MGPLGQGISVLGLKNLGGSIATVVFKKSAISPDALSHTQRKPAMRVHLVRRH